MANVYVTEDGVEVQKGTRCYDYYSMEPIIIGEDCGGGWFKTQSVTDPTKRSKSGMLNGSRVCSEAFAVRRGFPDAE